MTDDSLLLGLRTAIHPTSDLDAAKAWFTGVLGVEPYFDAPFYVGWQVGGYELALDPNGDPAEGVQVYWGVADADAAAARLLASGGTVLEAVHEVGDGIRTARFTMPAAGGTLGIIENPHFAVVPVASAGPGR